MRASLVRIGNSKGIRIPKAILEQCNITDEVNLEIKDNKIIIEPVNSPRKGWDEAFKKMAKNGDDKLLDMPESNWDEEEWEWK
ncbi:AbrB/MazE/SpoVT family DNA-binding domain-containing protein [Hippea alviniae]|uniref:AbrB/MazE/SpoVT family DNA-binding domain-containing protein n=1 Tax=Hippea alviniae TaxID=1279027 RepID=UPI0003B7A9D4|nr:AbrB/MazE/SpoVT family DNA-binding domain-containing protein [Hippea alviniae]